MKCLMKKGPTFEILLPHHIKAGLDIQEDDHVLHVRHHGVSILRYPTSGAMSKHKIRQDADDWLAKELNRQLPDRIIPPVPGRIW